MVNNTSCFSNGKKKLTKEDREIITETEPSFTEFGLTCQFALEGMREVTKGSNRVTGQCKIGGKLEGVDLPYLGYGDFQEGGIEFTITRKLHGSDCSLLAFHQNSAKIGDEYQIWVQNLLSKHRRFRKVSQIRNFGLPEARGTFVQF